MGALTGIRIVELAALGPGPFAAMMLADMGAEVVRIDRADAAGRPPEIDPRFELLGRGKRSMAVDLKRPEGVEAALRLIDRADGLVEGFRPGVMERLGLGPETCAARNPKLVYGRVTGWGREGPLAPAAGHDVNYIALAGVLHGIGPAERPALPLNLIGDFGGGGMALAFGMVCALLEASRSGKGQTVDAAILDGAALLMTLIRGWHESGAWADARGENELDGSAPYYDVYRTKDAKLVAVGALEAKFFAELIERLGLAPADVPAQNDRARWPEMREKFAEAFLGRTRDEWCAILEGSDACVAPVLGLAEAPSHPHNRARATFVELAGVTQPAPAPRLDRTPGAIRRPPPRPGEHTDAVLGELGFAPDEIADLRRVGTIA